MRENFGNGWVDRGPRVPVKGWDNDMQGTKASVGIDSRMLGYSEVPSGLIPDIEELVHGNAAPHVPHPEWGEGV